MVPGRRYNVAYVLRVMRRAWWMLFGPLVVAGSIAVVLARALPDVYYAQSVIQIIPPRLPENYVKGTITLSLPERLQAAGQQVLSTQQMQDIIKEFDVYPTLRARVPMDVLVSWFRASVRIAPSPKGDTFIVGYYGYSRSRVKKVAERLTTLMVQETMKQRETLADNTGQFLQSELDNARRRLEEHEQKVADYRKRYAGQLPTQVEANLRLLQGASSELQDAEQVLNRNLARRDELVRDLEAATTVESASNPADPEIADPPPGEPTATLPAGPAAVQLRAARILRARMLRRFTSAYPDVQALDRAIAQLEKAASAAPASPDAAPADDSARRAAQIRESLKALDVQIAASEATTRRLNAAVAAYRDRIDAAPEREAEWMRLTRDYNTLQGVYATLLAKREEARIAANVDRQAVGEQVKVLELPRLPGGAVSPNRRLVEIVGAGIGLGLGLALLALRELRDRTLRSEEEVLATLNLPVVGLVPMILTTFDRRRLRRRRLLWSFAALTLCVGIAALRWLR